MDAMEINAENIENIFITVDIKTTIAEIKDLVQTKINKNIIDYPVLLQQKECLVPSQTLIELCLDGEQGATINVNICHSRKFIDIVDVMKPIKEEQGGQMENADEMRKCNQINYSEF